MINKKNIDILKAISNKPTLFSINKVEDYYLFILGYSMANPKKNLLTFMNTKFSDFIVENYNSIDGIWYQIIRYQSTTDVHSLELFRKYFNHFLDIYGKNLDS